MLETVISGISDKFPGTLGKRKAFVLLAIFVLYFVTSVIFATQVRIILHLI